jgi:hypothetical protein
MRKLADFATFALSRAEAKQVLGGNYNESVGDATATCNDGRTISCSGAGTCTAVDGRGAGQDGSCQCGSNVQVCYSA